MSPKQCLSDLRLAVAAMAMLAAASLAGAAIEPGFTYQGELRLLGNPIAGEHDFRFRLYPEESGSGQVGPTLTVETVEVADGVFTVQLDFGAGVFSGDPRWLEIDVRASGSSDWETLSPRTFLATTPYAWAAALALPGSVTAASIEQGAVGGDQIDAAAVQRRVEGVCPTGEFVREVNQDGTVACDGAGSGGGAAWLLGGNAGTDPDQDYVGTSDDQPLVLGANALPLVRIHAVPASSGSFTANLVMGSPDNTVASGVRGATISGGGLAPTGPGSIVNPNRVFDHFGSVGGGQANVAGIDDGDPASAQWATIGGGLDNYAGGEATTVAGGRINQVVGDFGSIGGGRENFILNNGATIAGGEFNRAAGVSSTVAGGFDNQAVSLDSTIGGGSFIRASGASSTVSGGSGNTASGRGSVVSGGEGNCAGGRYSWVGGRRAKVRPGSGSGTSGIGCGGVASTPESGGDQGTFMWADSQSADFVSTGRDQFLVRAQGGIFFGTGSTVSMPSGRFINTDTGAYLTTGGTWTNASSRALKTDFQAVDPLEILDRVVDLPMSTWTYRSAPDNGRHLGPVAEEFHASFGLGSDDASITTVDASGVALAAVQGLNQRLEAENEALRRHNAAQDDAIAELRRELAELRGQVAGTSADGN